MIVSQISMGISYRELLDIWGLWEQRAHFDIQMGQVRSSPKYGRSVFLLCSFCGKSVSAFLQEESRMRPTSPNVNKVNTTPLINFSQTGIKTEPDGFKTNVRTNFCLIQIKLYENMN